MLSSFLSSSSSACLESLLLLTPGSPRFSVAGRLSYSAAAAHPFFSPTTPATPQPEPESDIGLQSPGTISSVSDAAVTYSDLVASSQCYDWPGTPQLEAGPQVPAQRQYSSGGESSFVQGGSSRPTTPRMDRTDGRCASILQVLSTPSPVEEIVIQPIDLFNHWPEMVGLGLTGIPPLAKGPRSTDEYRIIPIKEVPPGSLSRHYANKARSSDTMRLVSDARSKTPAFVEVSGPAFVSAFPTPSAHPIEVGPEPSSIVNQAHMSAIACPRPRFPLAQPMSPIQRPKLIPANVYPYPDSPQYFADSETSPRAESPSPDPRPVSVSALRRSKYAGLGLGLPSPMRCSDASARLPSVPEEETDTPVVTKAEQLAQLGHGLPSSRFASHSAPAQSQKPATSRVHSTFHELFGARRFVKRPLFAIPEARSREASEEARWAAESARDHESLLSPIMLLAAQSVLEEDRKYRKKEGLGKMQRSEMSPTMRLSLLVEEEQRRQGGRLEKAPKRFKFLF